MPVSTLLTYIYKMPLPVLTLDLKQTTEQQHFDFIFAATTGRLTSRSSHLMRFFYLDVQVHGFGLNFWLVKPKVSVNKNVLHGLNWRYVDRYRLEKVTATPESFGGRAVNAVSNVY